MVSDTFIDDAKAFLDDISVVPEGLIARKYASCMHDITESGVYGCFMGDFQSIWCRGGSLH